MARRWFWIAVAAVALAGCEDDETCADCRDEKCADLVELCEQDGDCACMSGCLGEAGIDEVDQCLADCGLDVRPPGFPPLEGCVAVACPDSDECSTPAGYEPPDDTVGVGPSTDCTLDGDGGGASIGSGEMVDCGFDTALAFDPTGEVLQLQSADGGVCVRIERRNEGRGSLANTEWTLLSLTIGPAGEVALIEQPACWYSSHHNFNDWIHASTDTRHYDLHLALDDHGGNRSYTLYTSERGAIDTASCAPIATGECALGGPVELVPVEP